MPRWLRTIAAAVFLAGVWEMIGPGVDDVDPMRTQDRAIPAVLVVEVATGGTLTITSGATPRLRVTARVHAVDHLVSRIRSARLVLGEDRAVRDLGQIRYDLTLPRPPELVLSGTRAALVQGDLLGIQEVVLAGSGDARITGVSTERLRVSLPDTGTFTVTGSARRQEVVVSGPGRYDGSRLVSQVADVTVQGSGRAAVQVHTSLQAMVEGSGSITYSGDAPVRGLIAGSGTIGPR